MPLILNYKGSRILFYFSIDIHHEMHLYYIYPFSLQINLLYSGHTITPLYWRKCCCMCVIYIVLWRKTRSCISKTLSWLHSCEVKIRKHFFLNLFVLRKTLSGLDLQHNFKIFWILWFKLKYETMMKHNIDLNCGRFTSFLKFIETCITNILVWNFISMFDRILRNDQKHIYCRMFSLNWIWRK